jgi:hypothetical protein
MSYLRRSSAANAIPSIRRILKQADLGAPPKNMPLVLTGNTTQLQRQQATSPRVINNSVDEQYRALQLHSTWFRWPLSGFPGPLKAAAIAVIVRRHR